jgi:hypothetical protein
MTSYFDCLVPSRYIYTTANASLNFLNWKIQVLKIYHTFECVIMVKYLEVDRTKGAERIY